MTNTKDLEKNRLLSKKELLLIVENDPNLNIEEFKKMKVDELRDNLKITHLINGKYKNMSGLCYTCFSPLRPDYTAHKNYCIDC
tara:strand:- start:152 stop:403 length:252 start_codon:yes stop_codon:yes gene_type:complete